ncbi:MAG: GcrA family cell cycle regulator [Methylocella sp.]
MLDDQPNRQQWSLPSTRLFNPDAVGPLKVLTALGEGRCKWPVDEGDRRRHLFCAEPATRQSARHGCAAESYCAFHAALSRPSQTRPRASPQKAQRSGSPIFAP